MENNIKLRELKKQDLPALENVIRKTWDYDKFATPKTARKLAKVYLATCLTNQTYTRIAEVDGVPAGLILGKNIEKHHCPLKYRLRQISALCGLLISKEGHGILNFYKNVDEIYSQLLKQCDKDYRGGGDCSICPVPRIQGAWDWKNAVPQCFSLYEKPEH